MLTEEYAKAVELWNEIQNLPNAENTQYQMDVIKLDQIVEGILKEALDAEDLSDISVCVTDMDTIFKKADESVTDFDKGGLTNIVVGTNSSISSSKTLKLTRLTARRQKKTGQNLKLWLRCSRIQKPSPTTSAKTS